MSPHSTTRPASILELAQRAQQDIFDSSKPLKSYLRLAEKNRTEARDATDQGDLETAFVKFARAATLVLEKLPSHRDYKVLLNEQQRTNLDLNGRDILDSLSEIKPILLNRYESWIAQHPNQQVSNPTRSQQARPPDADQTQRRQEEERQRVIREEGERAERLRLEQQRREQEEQSRMQEQARKDQQKREEELQRWEQQRQESRRREEDRAKIHRDGGPVESRSIDQRQTSYIPGPEKARQSESFRVQEESRLRQEDAAREQEQRWHEQEGILVRQREAESAARIARGDPGSSIPTGAPASLPYQAMPAPPAGFVPNHASTSAFPPVPHYPSLVGIHTPKASRSRPLSFLELTMPLESPTRPEDSETDTETAGKEKRNRQPSQRPPPRSPSYPPPITTTSPAPHDGLVQYPQLMTQHQKRQGYVPSLHSMFTPSTGMPASASLLLDEGARSRNQLYPTNIPPRSSNQYPYASHYSSTPTSQFTDPHHRPATSYQTTSYPTLPSSSSRAQPMPPDNRITRVPSSSSGPELKTVTLPRDSLPRFLSIARLNTSLNKETCGLLLGRDKGTKYVVTTLLIPKQHSTSDTCTMDEEELVLSFTEERSLITLGWIHTHPSQSCFMSSVDLHTHSGFQRMLPESFAVVCAPKHNPNFGIFRLTDPPGLQTILDCQAKEAFHPHPEVPIYTDADKGHVQMRDMALEIVDLR